MKKSKSLIGSILETERLILRDAKLSEYKDIQKMYETGSYLKDIIGDIFDKNHIYKCLTEGDLPPIENAKKENYALKCICNKSDDRLIGIFDVYHGYPDEKNIWISYLYIHPKNQSNGLGHEVIECICSEAKNNQYNKVTLAVSLKNWNAINFWVNNKFNNIIGVFGDKEFSSKNMALIGLARTL